MRMHIEMDDELIRRVDDVAGTRGRSQFVRDAVVTALDQQARAELIRASRGSIVDRGHAWDDDAATWVRSQRRSDDRRVG